MPDAPQLVCLAAVPWDFKLVGRTRMLVEAWRRVGQPVWFVEIPSWRAALRRLWPLGSARPDFVIPTRPGLPVRLWSLTGAGLVRRSIRGPARSLVQRLDRVIDWKNATALLVTPSWTPWLAELPFAHLIYDCIDDLTVQTPSPRLLPMYRRFEDELLDRCSGAVASATLLADDIRQRRPTLPVTTIRNGVDTERFRERAARGDRPTDMPPPVLPILGFVGALYEWIDWPLIVNVAAALPRVQLVFVGPHDGRSDVGSVASLLNVTLLGPKPYGDVPAYINAFDVCWVPFKQDQIAAAANPVKLYEYLALGKPTITTPVADVDSFEGLISVARTADEVVGQVLTALAADSKEAEARRAFADRNSWDARAVEYVEFAKSL